MSNQAIVFQKNSLDASNLNFFAIKIIDNGDDTFSLFVEAQDNPGVPSKPSLITETGLALSTGSAGKAFVRVDVDSDPQGAFPELNFIAGDGMTITPNIVAGPVPRIDLTFDGPTEAEGISRNGSSISIGVDGQITIDANDSATIKILCNDNFTFINDKGLRLTDEAAQVFTALFCTTTGNVEVNSSPTAGNNLDISVKNATGLLRFFTNSILRWTIDANGNLIGAGAVGLTIPALTANAFLFSGVGGLLTSTAAPTNGQVLIGSTGAAPSLAALTQGTGILITNGAGSITIAQVADTVNQQVRISNGGTLVGTRREVNFIPGSNVTLTISDNAGSNRVDVTIAASTGGAVGGSGTANTVPKFTASTTLGDSPITTAGNNISVVGAITSGGNLTAAAANNINWSGRSNMQSPADGEILITNSGGTSFTSLRLGPLVRLNPAAALLTLRNNADNADAAIQALNYKVAGTQVVGAQGAAVADAAGGATVDTEARAAINALLARVRTHGLIAP